MKHFYNYIAILMLMLAFGSARAEESRLFSQDFSWTYQSDWWDSDLHQIQWTVKFGEEVEHNGKTYRALVTDQALNWDYNSAVYLPCEVKDQPCLVRIEGGKVYAVVPESYLFPDFLTDFKYDENEEHLIYDFDCPVGETYKALFCTGEMREYKVTDVTEIEVASEKRRCQKVKDSEYGYEFSIIEDIGYIDRGFLTYLWVPMRAAGKVQRAPGAPYDSIYLSFISNDSGLPILFGSNYRPFQNATIQAGNVWEYVSRSQEEDATIYCVDRYDFRNIQDVNEERFGDWHHIDRTVWTVVMDDNGEKVTGYSINLIDEVKASLVENTDGICKIADKGEIKTYSENETGVWTVGVQDLKGGERLPLYNWTYEAMPENRVELIMATGTLNDAGEPEFVLTSAEVMTRVGENIRYEGLQPKEEIVNPYNRRFRQSGEADVVTVVRRIGNIGAGDMTTLGITDRSVEYQEGYYPMSFNRLLDASGEVIYEGKNIEVPSFAGLADIDIEAEHPVVYDLFGRAIADPQPGTVYIRNGRKFVQR